MLDLQVWDAEVCDNLHHLGSSEFVESITLAKYWKNAIAAVDIYKKSKSVILSPSANLTIATGDRRTPHKTIYSSNF